MLFDIHIHTEYSNIRLLDCINRTKALAKRAISIGLKGIAITDHECLSSHLKANKLLKTIQKDNPDFKIALGNEIYLTDTRSKNQKYYHFILVAKDKIGYTLLRELSSMAWFHSYFDRGMERVPTLKSELKAIVEKYGKGHLIASTACLGGELCFHILEKIKYQTEENSELVLKELEHIYDFIEFCKDLFDEDFYFECAPAKSPNQIKVNQALIKIAKAFNIKVIYGSDAHYVDKDSRFIHKAYLNSKEGDREVDSFYEFTYLMSEEEARENLSASFSQIEIDQIFQNSIEIYDKITNFSIQQSQRIPTLKLKEINEPIEIPTMMNLPSLQSIVEKDEIQSKTWLYECIKGLNKIDKINDKIYWERLETEADVVLFISNKLSINLFAYFNTFQHYIDIFWECGSIVGPGRGSATGFLSNYLMGITQLDPIVWDLKWWRFLNKERAELPDIDIDLAPSKRAAIFDRIRQERGFFGLAQVSTFGTEGTKSTVLTACRGYKTEEEPDGIDVDIAQYISSLIPSHRGFLWSLKDVVEGDPDNGRAPIKPFIDAVEQYPGLLDIMLSIEGLINKRSIHASGVILYEQEEMYETSAFMKAPNGTWITQFDLHDAEEAGDTKYDFLATEVSDKIATCIDLLVKDKVIEDDKLRNIYNKTFHPEVIKYDNPKIWHALANNTVIDVFQFSESSGISIARKLQPKNPVEMTSANALMRLMSEKDTESQQDRYARIKESGIEEFDREMNAHNLPTKVIKAMHKHCDVHYGCVPLQEQMMEILMDEDLCNFSLASANDARRIVGKKQMERIPELKEKVFQSCENNNIAQYVWTVAIAPSMGYAFSLNHSLPYSFVGIQTLYCAIVYNQIYWNTACLIVNSGGADEDEGSSTDYGKIAKAIGDIRSAGIKVSLSNINTSDFGFKPDVENNQILFGLKGMINVGDEVIKEIIQNRDCNYTSFNDFISRIKADRRTIISLIKGGAFDSFDNRKLIMGNYIWSICDKKSKVNLQNMASLIKREVLPESLSFECAIYNFNRYLKAFCKNGTIYNFDERAEKFYLDNFGDTGLVFLSDKNVWTIDQKLWDKYYKFLMSPVREWLKNNQEQALTKLNESAFLESWQKYAVGTISAWEMESLCFYYHEHELAHINKEKYGLIDFFDLPESPEIDYQFKKGMKTISIFKLSKIFGTCISKNKTKGTVTLLTPKGVVNVKFRKEYFSMFDKQISERQPDGSKKIIEKSWFARGSMIVVQGIRDEDSFIPKKYAKSNTHQLYKINSIDKDGNVTLRDKRKQGEESEDTDCDE